jgi:hypothetical protein
MNNQDIDPQLATLLELETLSTGISEALGKPRGARFYKAALQVNPFGYSERHAKKSRFKGEEEYNKAVVEACLKENIEVVGLTDHFRVATSRTLAVALRKAGIHVFPGFEASTSEGVHLLCLFPPSTSDEELERIVGACGVVDLTAESPLSDKNCE